MSDIITRLLLDSKGFDTNLSRSRKNVASFEKSMSGMASRAGSAILKFGGTLGIAMGGIEAFNKVMSSSQTLGDSYESTIYAAKTSVDQFFYSIGSGDWSGFFQGLDSTISKAKDARTAIDALGNTKMSYSYFDSANRADFAKYSAILKDKDASEADKTEAKNKMKSILDSQSKMVEVYNKKTLPALQKLVAAGTNLNPDDISIGDINSAIELDISIGGDDTKAKLAKEYEEYVKYISQLKSTNQHIGLDGKIILDYASLSESDRKGVSFNPAMQYQKDEALQKLNEQYKKAIIYNKLLERFTDEELQNLISIAIECKTVAQNYESMVKSANKLTQVGTVTPSVGGNSMVYTPSMGSLDKFNADMAQLVKDFNATTDGAIRISIQRKIDELQAVIDQLKFSANGYLEPDKIGGKMAGLPTQGISLPTMLPKIEGTITDKTISNTFDYIDSLYGVANAMSAISNATSEGGASWVSYSAGVVGSVAAMMPALASLLGIESALGIAEQAKIPFPFNIAAMTATGAGLAASIAALPKFESGGLVPGISYSGDKVLARVNSGEMILNKSQQSNLFNLLDGGVSMSGSGGTDKVEFKIKDRTLVGILNKNSRIKKRIR